MFWDIAGIFLTLLPAGWRGGWLSHWRGNLRKSAVLSGALELLAAVALLIFRYQRYASAEMAKMDPRVLLAAAEKAGESAIQSLGMMFLITYVMTPLSLLLIYLGLEGVFRFGAAIGTGEVVGTLPLVLVDKLFGMTGKYGQEVMQGPRVPDLVFQPETDDGERYDLGVASCRKKEDWDHLITISYDGVLYEVAASATGKPPRTYLYLLRRAPVHKIVRHLHEYDPKEGLGAVAKVPFGR